MEKKSNRIRKLLHRDSLPILSFGPGKDNAAKETKARRKSEGTIPEHVIEREPSWYLKEVKTRDAAEELLTKQRVGTFLVRDSETSKLPGSYTLSLRHKDKFRHHKIETNPRNSKLVIKGYENHQFDDLEKLVDFFINSQRKDIFLKPYDPNAEYQDNGKGNNEEQQAAYEEMDGSECQDAYQQMENDVAASKMSRYGFIKTQGPPPTLPTRPSDQGGYMNIAPKGVSTPPPPPPTKTYTQSYENIPSRERSPLPPPPSSKDAPPKLPPRVPANTGPGSYENIPGRPPRNYENYNTDRKYENHQQTHSAPGHSYQNLPPKITPRKAHGGRMSYSDE
ncbi:GRB2-related adapter protein 2-like [Actinia tenebrosa]|uniref:GRB2-related adapter protein 2-like n=1 Tax=Actinia tenebrosa TaxID=6105 RepID=A0A6P8J2P1_ACTTE|nr:GRB2-related adapter protein 2-like [Actinia tenebrosa]